MSPQVLPGFDELVAAMPVAMLVVDPGGRIALANAACETLLNFSERAMTGQEVDAFVRFDQGFADRRKGRTFAAAPSAPLFTCEISPRTRPSFSIMPSTGALLTGGAMVFCPTSSILVPSSSSLVWAPST